jgi:hypothetical protein
MFKTGGEQAAKQDEESNTDTYQVFPLISRGAVHDVFFVDEGNNTDILSGIYWRENRVDTLFTDPCRVPYSMYKMVDERADSTHLVGRRRISHHTI